jgi:hypothetical protein
VQASADVGRDTRNGPVAGGKADIGGGEHAECQIVRIDESELERAVAQDGEGRWSDDWRERRNPCARQGDVEWIFIGIIVGDGKIRVAREKKSPRRLRAARDGRTSSRGGQSYVVGVCGHVVVSSGRFRRALLALRHAMAALNVWKHGEGLPDQRMARLLAPVGSIYVHSPSLVQHVGAESSRGANPIKASDFQSDRNSSEAKDEAAGRFS